MKLYYQKYFIIVCLTALIYFVVKTAVILKFIDHDYLVNVFEYAVFIFLLYYQFLFYKSYKKNIKKGISDLEYFLDNVAEWILEIDRGNCVPWHSNYSAWLKQKHEKIRTEIGQL